MKIIGKTLDRKGELIDVYECEFCKRRSIFEEAISLCERLDHHKEEHAAGCL